MNDQTRLCNDLSTRRSLTCGSDGFGSQCLDSLRSGWIGCRWLLLLLWVSLAGCNGCQRDDQQLTREELEQRAREQRESLELSSLVSLPADSEAKIFIAKPGHWHQTQQKFKSNRENMQVVAVGSVARGTEQATVPGTNIVNEFTRRTSLPKGQTKTVDLQYFIPSSGMVDNDPLSGKSTQLRMRTELLSWPLMTPILQAPSIMPAKELKAHEFQLIAMGPQALAYEYLTVLDAVYWRSEEFAQEERTRSYYVTLVKPIDNAYAIPDSMLSMTSIAVLVWDDVSPDELSQLQQQAVLDWVHWGGQLIVSGPSSWSRLQNSFLSPYLPASSAEVAEFVTEDFAEMSATWVVDDRARNAVREPLEIIGPAVGGLKFSLREDGQWLPGAGELVAESQVGRGRIVLTSFPMREPRVYRWKYFSSFFSTGLLRRHSREFRRSKLDRSIAQYWTRPFESSQRDPRMHSDVRILSRDLTNTDPSRSATIEDAAQPESDYGSKRMSPEERAMATTVVPPRSVPRSESMMWGGSGAAWNDYSGLSFQALNALKSAAGIELPSRKTILVLLAGYLACLVPLNWLVFRLIGRLELAWLAAPIMALIGVAVVTKVARLDIGFARRTTEISLLELHSGHDRGHLTQYLALYTSLSTNYSIEFPETDSVALPLGDRSRQFQRAGAEERTLRTNYGRAEGVNLEPLTVYSNSTEMLHAEQMVSMQGALRVGRRSEDGTGPLAVKNDTGLPLRSAMVVRRTETGQLEKAWIGDLPSAQSASLTFRPTDWKSIHGEWEEDPTTQSTAPTVQVGAGTEDDALWIGGVLHQIVRTTPLVAGQMRLIAYTNERPTLLSLSPSEDQFDGRCVIVAHLSPPTLGGVTPDKNIMSRMTSDAEAPENADDSQEIKDSTTPK